MIILWYKPKIIYINFEYNNNSIYELYSILNLIGKTDFELYYSYIKWFDDNLWNEYDDSNYILIDNSLVDYDKAYLLSITIKIVF